jgi:hypothetical protein
MGRRDFRQKTASDEHSQTHAGAAAECVNWTALANVCWILHPSFASVGAEPSGIASAVESPNCGSASGGAAPPGLRSLSSPLDSFHSSECPRKRFSAIRLGNARSPQPRLSERGTEDAQTVTAADEERTASRKLNTGEQQVQSHRGVPSVETRPTESRS